MKSILIAALVFSAATVSALTLKEQKALKEFNDYMKDGSKGYSAAMKKNCGFEAPVKLDEKMIPEFMAANRSLTSYCETPHSVMSSMCEDATSKAAIVKSIKRVECRLGKKDELTVKIEKGTLIFTTGIEAPNLDARLKEWLENNLN